MSGDELRIGDREREEAAAVLGDHYAEGRLDPTEHAERLDAVWTARTRADLEVLFHDRPARGRPAAPPSRGARGPRARGVRGPGWRGLPFVPVAALLVVLSVVTMFPFWVLIFFLGCGWFGRRQAWGAGRGQTHGPAWR